MPAARYDSGRAEPPSPTYTLDGRTVTIAHPRIPEPDPGVMTGRAQAYLVAASLMQAMLGYYCVFRADLFLSPSYSVIRRLPLWGWGLASYFVAALCLWAAASRRERPARWGLILSAVVSAAWSGVFLAAWSAGVLTGPTGIIGWVSNTLKDLVVCGNPLRSPLEAYTRKRRKALQAQGR